MPLRPTSIYRRLGGQGATLTNYVRLYLGPDHLLQASSTGYSETYKRFYFRDIQAIIIRKTGLWTLWILLWLLPGLLFTGLALAALLTNGARAAVVFFGIAAVFFIGTGINLALGPTCVCHLRTAVQTEKLPSLKRLRKTRKILSQIRPLIETAQGKMTAEGLVPGKAGGAWPAPEESVQTPPSESPGALGAPTVLTDDPRNGQ